MKTTSLELSKQLKEAGIEIETYFYYGPLANYVLDDTAMMRRYTDEFRIIDGLNQHPAGLNFREWVERDKYIPAPTTDELLEWFAKKGLEVDIGYFWDVDDKKTAKWIAGSGIQSETFRDKKNPADALARLAIWVKKEGKSS